MRIALVIFALTAAASIVIGLLWDPVSFSQNMLAEVAGTLISILTAALIVDALLKRERDRQTRGIRRALNFTTRTFLQDFAHACYAYFALLPPYLLPAKAKIEPYDSVSRIAEWVTTNFGTLTQTEKPVFPRAVIVRKMIGDHAYRTYGNHEPLLYVPHQQVITRLRNEFDRASLDLSSSLALYSHLEPLLHRLSGEIIPRALQIADDPSDVEQLINAEKHWSMWQQSMDLVNDDWGAPPEFPWRDFLALARVLAEVEKSTPSTETLQPDWLTPLTSDHAL